MLTNRQIKILQLVIDLFSQYKEPIGSKTLREACDLSLSTATLRNELSALEKAGLLEKYHTSSGRAPSSLGYRYYIDKILPYQNSPLTHEDLEKIRPLLSRPVSALEDFLIQSAELLSDLAHFTTVSRELGNGQEMVDSVRLFPIDRNRYLVVMLLSDGSYEERLINTKDSLDLVWLEEIERQMNLLIHQRSIKDSRRCVNEWLKTVRKEPDQNQVSFMDQIGRIFEMSSQVPIHISGRSHLLEATNDLDTVRKVYYLLDDDQVLGLLTDIDQDFQVRIGSEIGISGLEEFAVVTRHFRLPDNSSGVLSIIGPTHMPYQHLRSVMNYLAEEVIKQNNDKA
ncbi:heat-inducible transcription repressor HrcA [Atopobacter sp. AH10]|uniref:heat-inducible transcriptional repressor HrcA n=1 Tax=Atopobacter sp. AH10 TaxID=2315861 RepID=UPI000EF1D1E9|nr:heat-inducible transcriptional repressor HrcA [Atopobacter sp. AH10]RLK63406.1 heat-inducible transcription repressor HrcA [Atopobacter sp. AH10]